MAFPVRSLKVDSLKVQIYASGEDLAAEAALAARSHLQMCLAGNARATALFGCAASQVKFLAALVQLPGIDWSRIMVFHMDEYLGLSESHPASLRRFLKEHLTDKVRPAMTHLIGGDSAEPMDEVDRYSQLLRRQPLDLCCLGIGENGHVAFNDPPVANFADERWVKLVQLDEACRQQQVGEGCFPRLSEVPAYAITLTIPALCQARRILGVVPERRKAEAVKRALQGPVVRDCPASILRRQAHATLFLDADSASLL